MPKTFASQKFHSLILANTLAMLAEFLTLFFDNVIAGNMLGEDALSAITLVTPFFSLLVFTAFLVATGTSIVISGEVGEGSRENADKFFSQGVILSSGLSAVMTAAFFAIYLLFPNLFGASEAVNAHVADYLFHMCLLPAPLLLGALFYNILLNEGGEAHAIVSTLVQLVGNIALSIVLCPLMGIGGISLATVASSALGTAVLAAFFLSRRNPFRFRWFLNARAALRVAQYSIVDASVYLYTFLMPLCMNIFLLHRFGTDGVVVFTVVLNAQILMVAAFDGINESVQPLISVYRAENFQTGIGKTMRYATRAAVIEGVLMTALLAIVADYVPAVFGITTPELVAESAAAIRILALSACAVSLLVLFMAYFLYMGKILFSALTAMGYYFILPVALGIALGEMFGQKGVWAGLAAAGVVALLACLLAARRLYGGTNPPLLDSAKLERELSYDVPRTPESIDALVARVERDLLARGVARDRVLKIMMMIDSTEMYSMEKGVEEGVVVECDISLDDVVTLILRDTGDRDDVMNEGTAAAPPANPDDTSLNFVCRSVLGSHRNRQHILTSGKNRSIFHF